LLLYEQRGGTAPVEIWALDRDSHEVMPVLRSTGGNLTKAQWSPDGRWIAYQSTETGRQEVYIQRFPTAGAKIPISTDGGGQPRWSGDGKALFYVTRDAMMMVRLAVDSTTQMLTPGPPVKLFQAHIAGGGPNQQYAVARDGRFLINVGTTDQTPITIVQNWPALLKK
jgi:dipeptidyl aminopeptidase/acylaminoacyl peptidase